ncbi:MAG: hypothetical protein LQ350_007909 [Teloschistes chrysophthalmus]|nr:MAG: hypothetical protein LQ350_007909 [Niorma chrysophthalma]
MTEERRGSDEAYKPTERADADRKVSTQPQQVISMSMIANRFLTKVHSEREDKNDHTIMIATFDAAQLEKGLQQSPTTSFPSSHENTASSTDSKSELLKRFRQYTTCNYPKGFPQLSTFQDSDDAFPIYRRFGTLFSRLLLTKQDEIRRMECELEAMDRTDHANGDIEYLRTTVEDERREDPLPAGWPQGGRRKLLGRLERGLVEYADILLKARQLKAVDRPSSRDYQSVLHFMEADEGQLYEAEMDFIYEKEDLVTLRPGRDHGWLDISRDKTSPAHKEIHYYCRRRIATFATLLITLGVLGLLLVPIWLLYRLSVEGTITTCPSETIGVILGFTLAFFGVLKAFTRAKRHEIVAASATYCALMVVFLGGVNQTLTLPKH